MNVFRKIDHAVDVLASALSDSPKRKPTKIFLYMILVAVTLWIPYLTVRHVSTSGFHVVSVEREARVGLEVAEKVEHDMIIFPEDDSIALYVDELGHRIARQTIHGKPVSVFR